MLAGCLLWTFAYDDLNRLIRRTDSVGAVTTLTYDALSRQLTKWVQKGAVVDITTSAYDVPAASRYHIGRLTNLENAHAIIRYEYDIGGRLLVERTTLKNALTGALITPVYSTTSYWNAAGKLIQRSYPDGDLMVPSGTLLAYDTALRLKTIPGLIDDIAYNARGQALTVDYANGVTSRFTYHPTRTWVTKVEHLNPLGAALMSLTYSRDAAGRISRMASGVATETFDYSYDGYDQLIAPSSVFPRHR